MAAENFAQTRPEAPIEDNLTPAQEAAQSEPTDASGAAGFDALEAAAAGNSSGPISAGRGGGRLSSTTPPTPTNMVYIGNLYYEVTEEQLKRVFGRFGSILSTKIVFDNRGMSRG